jgi:hypothetical protein
METAIATAPDFSQPGKFITAWMAAGIVGLAGMELVNILPATVGWPAYGLLAALPVGQWLVLRWWKVGSAWWLLVTLLGFIIGVMAGGVLGGILQDRLDGVPFSPLGIAPIDDGFGRSLGNAIISNALAGAGAGLLLGLVQWLVLRKKARGGVRWLLANVFGLGGAFAMETLLSRYLSSMFVVILMGGFYGAVSGWALVTCLRARAVVEARR